MGPSVCDEKYVNISDLPVTTGTGYWYFLHEPSMLPSVTKVLASFSRLGESTTAKSDRNDYFGSGPR